MNVPDFRPFQPGKRRADSQPDDTKQEGDGKSEPQMTPYDWSRINVNDEHDLIYWSSRFDCTRNQLTAAVASAGVAVALVEKALLDSQ